MDIVPRNEIESHWSVTAPGDERVEWDSIVINEEPGRTIVAVWGCGPVGQFAIRSAMPLGAAKVYAIDSVPERRRRV